MSVLILLVAALFPAIFLWYYIWKQYLQAEPTNCLVLTTKSGKGKDSVMWLVFFFLASFSIIQIILSR